MLKMARVRWDVGTQFDVEECNYEVKDFWQMVKLFAAHFGAPEGKEAPLEEAVAAAEIASSDCREAFDLYRRVCFFEDDEIEIFEYDEALVFSYASLYWTAPEKNSVMAFYNSEEDGVAPPEEIQQRMLDAAAAFEARTENFEEAPAEESGE